MKLFDILSSDERVIVYSDVGARVIYTWNRSLTLQAWLNPPPCVWKGGNFSDADKDNWVEVEVQTLSVEPKTYEKARKAAIAWAQA